MRQALLPENFRSIQQDNLFAMLDDLYEDGPRIGVVTAPPGTGKTHALRQYVAEVKERHKSRLEQRRVITTHDARARLRAAGCLRNREDLQWLKDSWYDFNGRDRISEAELNDLILRRGTELGVPPEQLPKKSTTTDLPCPRPIIVTPSQTTSENAMMKVLAGAVTLRYGGFWSTFDAREALMESLQEPKGSRVFLIVD